MADCLEFNEDEELDSGDETSTLGAEKKSEVLAAALDSKRPAMGYSTPVKEVVEYVVDQRGTGSETLVVKSAPPAKDNHPGGPAYNHSPTSHYSSNHKGHNPCTTPGRRLPPAIHTPQSPTHQQHSPSIRIEKPTSGVHQTLPAFKSPYINDARIGNARQHIPQYPAQPNANPYFQTSHRTSSNCFDLPFFDAGLSQLNVNDFNLNFDLWNPQIDLFANETSTAAVPSTSSKRIEASIVPRYYHDANNQAYDSFPSINNMPTLNDFINNDFNVYPYAPN